MTREEAILLAWEAASEALDIDKVSDAEMVAVLLASLAASGYAIVPVEATEEMIEVGMVAFYAPNVEQTAEEDIRIMYRAMLAAAQKEQG